MSANRDEAIRAALFAHDGMVMLLDQGLDVHGVEPEPTGFLAALEGLGYTVVDVAATREVLDVERLAKAIDDVTYENRDSFVGSHILAERVAAAYLRTVTA